LLAIKTRPDFRVLQGMSTAAASLLHGAMVVPGPGNVAPGYW
jgi:hypothetical protein